MSNSGFAAHDHSACIAEGLSNAEKRAAEENLRLTPARRRVLEILLEEHRALGAYDILARLKSEGMSAQPPMVYRALEFLIENRLAHRVERLNAFVACTQPCGPHAPIIMICRNCDAVAETGSRAAREQVQLAAHDTGFQVDLCAIEAEGLCQNCAESTPA